MPRGPFLLWREGCVMDRPAGVTLIEDSSICLGIGLGLAALAPGRVGNNRWCA